MSSRPSLLRRSSAPLAAVSIVAIFAGAASLAGCPIYSANSCEEDPNCPQTTPGWSTGYDGGTATNDGGTDVSYGGCYPACAAGYQCDGFGDGTYACVAQDCRATNLPCSNGEQCTAQSDGTYACATPPAPTCTTTGCVTGYSCTTSVAGTSRCTSTDPNACSADSDCTALTGAGSLCLGGSCKAPKDLCSDSSQCASNETCENGACIVDCTTTCPDGYSCDANGICTGGANACGSASSDAGTSGGTCGANATCVGGRCVDPCNTDGSCPTGEVCAGGGCVIDDRPTFFCDKSGTADGTQDVCTTGSICLHHNCYIACTSDTTCQSADSFTSCKTVTTSSGTHQVCGSTTGLGSECDPTTTPPKTCASAGQVCIDGYCR